MISDRWCYVAICVIGLALLAVVVSAIGAGLIPDIGVVDHAQKLLAVAAGVAIGAGFFGK
jgi:hypothetical protein